MSGFPSHPTAEVQFIVQVDRAGSVRDVVESLRAEGLAVDQVLEQVGIIGGHGPQTLAGALRGVAGVRMVREEGVFQLPPLDPDVPQ